MCGPPNSCSGSVLVNFALVGPATGTTTRLRIDNVFDNCVTVDATNAELIPYVPSFANCPCDGGLPYESCSCGTTPAERALADCPAISTWGLLVLAALVLLSGRMLLRRAGVRAG